MMRVIIAPDSFGETLTATSAARAIGRGWSRSRPEDDLEFAPQSDGGPGFVDVLAASIGHKQSAKVEGPLGVPVSAEWLLDGSTAYIECAQACGLGLLGGPPSRDSALQSSSAGVGQLVREALGAGAATIVVGLGGSSCTDGGRGLIGALGGLDVARHLLSGVDLVAASDVDNPLLGGSGAAHVFGPQKGADHDTVAVLEERNRVWAAELSAGQGAAGLDAPVADRPGAGAAGGIGAALFALGASMKSGATVVAERTGQDQLLQEADLVLTGEGKFDHQSLRGKLVSALASAGSKNGLDTIVLAGQVTLTAAQIADAGIVRAYSISEFAGSVELAMSDAGHQLELLAAEVAAGYITSHDEE